MKEDGNISKRGYCMAQYSKWVRPGDVRIDATEQPNTGILVSAYKHSDKQITIVAVNTSGNEVTQQFSVDGRNITNVYSESAQKVMLSLQYTNASGETAYAHIADAETAGGYVQLANANYKIPEGASSLILYIETEEGTGDLFLDEVIGAVAGTQVEGAKPQPKKGDIRTWHEQQFLDLKSCVLNKMKKERTGFPVNQFALILCII